MTSASQSAAAVPLHGRVEGNGHPLIVLHGLLGSSANWAGQIRRLGAFSEVHALDLRNHGDSPWTAEMSFELMAADVAAYAGARGWEEFDLMGHSLGGKAAMWLALSQPEHIRKLIIVDIAPSAHESDHHLILVALWEAEGMKIKHRKDMEAQLRSRLGDHELLPFFLHGMRVGPDGTLGWRANVGALREHYAELKGPVDCAGTFEKPALFLLGEKSAYVDETGREEIMRRFPQAQIRVCAGAGHLPHIETPAVFAREVEMFLAPAQTGAFRDFE